MKYIRTKDGIYRNASVPTDLVIICRDRECEVNPSDIINQSNTIEELCDEFVCVHKESDNKTIHKSYWFAVSVKEECKQIYGAIWTDKNLKYVAKMNEEGELELL